MEEIIDLFARERFKSYVVKFYQTLALPKDLLDINNSKNFGNFKFINQWRIDYPENIKTDIPKEHLEKTVYLVILDYEEYPENLKKHIHDLERKITQLEEYL